MEGHGRSFAPAQTSGTWPDPVTPDPSSALGGSAPSPGRSPFACFRTGGCAPTRGQLSGRDLSCGVVDHYHRLEASPLRAIPSATPLLGLESAARRVHRLL